MTIIKKIIDGKPYAPEKGSVSVPSSGTSATIISAVVDKHHAKHENSGVDELTVVGLSGVLADDQHPIDTEVVSIAKADADIADALSKRHSQNTDTDLDATFEVTLLNTDNHTSGATNKVYTGIEQTKLAGIETGAEVNNISDVNATALTDGNETSLHKHAGVSIAIMNEVAYYNTTTTVSSLTTVTYPSLTELSYVKSVTSSIQTQLDSKAPLDSPTFTGTQTGLNIASGSDLKFNSTKVIGARVIDARCDDAVNSGDATTDGVIDSLRDAMIAHGLIAAA